MGKLDSIIEKIKNAGFDFTQLPDLLDALIDFVQDLAEVVPEAGPLGSILSVLQRFKHAVNDRGERIEKHWAVLSKICEDDKITLRETPAFIAAVVGISRVVLGLGVGFIQPTVLTRLYVVLNVMERIGTLLDRITPKLKKEEVE